MLFWMWCVCFLHCLVKKQQNNLIHSYITLWCVLNAVCVLCNAGKETGDQWKTFLQHPLVCFEYRVCSLHCMVKEQQTCATYLTTPSGVFWISCVFLALLGKETAGQFNTFLHHTLVCFEYRLCSLHSLVKKNSRPVQHLLTKPSGVFLIPCDVSWTTC